MNRGRNTALVLILIVIILGVFAWEYRDSALLAPLFGSNNTPAAQTQTAVANYMCDANKTIIATYFAGATATSTTPNTPPTPNGSVALVLSDGRNLTLPETISGSGIRYTNADGSIVFWSEGNAAFITEGANQQQTFANCVATSNISGQESWATYASSSLGYSVRYPQGYTLNTAYVNQTMGPGKNIKGIQVTIPATMATGTNLSSDSGVSIEQLPGVTSCTADLFLGDQVGSTTQVTDNGVTYSFAQGSDAGAGNLYTEMVYAIPGSASCTAVRYFIHSTQIGNYPAGTVVAFNQPALLKDFDGIRESLVLSGK
jgi:membrane-bound inhibitor of C-type lysozyme